MLPSYLIGCFKCKKPNSVPIPIHKSAMKWKCVCGNINSVSISMHIGDKLLQMAYMCYQNEDYMGTIVYSAFAVECRLSQQWLILTKLKRITDAYQSREKPLIEVINKMTDEALEKELRNIGSINNKFKKFEKLACPEGIENFLSQQEIAEILINFPSLKIPSFFKDVEETIFWPRNHIIHIGLKEYSKEEAERVYNVANLTLGIIDKLSQRQTK